MDPLDIEHLEIELLLEAVFQRYGFDFRNYARASLRRRIRHFLAGTSFDRPSEAIPDLLHDRTLMDSLVYHVSIPVTEMFRDPFVYAAIRKEAVAFLRTFPFIRVWHAGCATGEEVYSLAILLLEEGLYDRTRIYATDFSTTALESARKGIYPVDRIRTYTSNYQKAGGKASFSRYYHSKYESVIMDQALRKNIVFADHNLASDAAFGEMQFIMCRNVLIYFDQELQNRALDLFHESLVYKGLLCLGTKESIRYSSAANRFETVMEQERIFQRV